PKGKPWSPSHSPKGATPPPSHRTQPWTAISTASVKRTITQPALLRPSRLRNDVVNFMRESPIPLSEHVWLQARQVATRRSSSSRPAQLRILPTSPPWRFRPPGGHRKFALFAQPLVAAEFKPAPAFSRTIGLLGRFLDVACLG